MKISLNWIKEFTDVKLGVDELVEKIGAQLGAVEEVVNLGERYKGIVVVKVITSEKHPNADKLHICKIDDTKVVKGVKRDENGLVQVVCGAPNVRAGMLAAWLPPGTTVPSSLGEAPFVLESRDIRGVKSNGMLASAHELAISDDHSGIVEIQPQDAKPGDDFAKTYKLDDYIIDIENKMFTHRPDCFGILGVAREVAGITHKAFQSPGWYKTPLKLNVEEPDLPLKIDNNLPKLVPRFTAVVVRTGHNGPSPLWLQTYLSRVGLRPINAVVDITNYFMYLTGQPLHVYDYDKLAALSNGPVSLETRLSKKGEKLKLLSGKEITFQDTTTILITSHDKAVGIGGVMGGAETEVDENTKKIVLECANFDMYTIRKTAMSLGLFTDAVTRFNKGQSSLQQDRVLIRAVAEVCKLAHGSVASEMIDKHVSPDYPKSIRVSAKFINDRLGEKLSPAKIASLLENVEFKVMKMRAGNLAVTPPFWRTDIEIPEDVVEEVGRLYGYDHLSLELPKRNIKPAKRNDLLDIKSQIRSVLSEAGANEVLTYSFVHGNLLGKVDQDHDQAFRLSNALSPDLQYYRMSLLPSVLERIHPNVKAGYKEFVIFELNKAHNKLEADQHEKVPKESNNLALVVATDSDNQNGAAYYQARNYLDYLAKSLGVDLRYEPFTEPPDYPAGKPFDYKRAARVYLAKSDKILGVVGEFKPEVKSGLKLPAYTAGFEIAIGSLRGTKINGYTKLSRYPSVQQDISLKVPTKTPYGEIYNLLLEQLEAIEDVKFAFEPLDIYQGEDKAHKNLTFRLTIASYEKTMTAPEVNKLLDYLAAKAHEKFGAERI
jgi:phenylalanyl-tRNA synthetase beta chain